MDSHLQYAVSNMSLNTYDIITHPILISSVKVLKCCSFNKTFNSIPDTAGNIDSNTLLVDLFVYQQV
jgi:hypothetical protein